MLCKICKKEMKAGLTLYTCECGYAEPTLLQKGVNITKSVIKHVENGMVKVSKEIQDQRLEICRGCEFFNGNNPKKPSCNKCGCFLKIKTAWASDTCPIEKWHDVKTGENSEGCGCNKNV